MNKYECILTKLPPGGWNIEIIAGLIQSHALFMTVFFKLFSSRPILHGQIFSRPLKKGLRLNSISDSAIFPPTSRFSLKKRSSSRIDLWFRYFFPKIKVFSKPVFFKLFSSRPTLHGQWWIFQFRGPRQEFSKIDVVWEKKEVWIWACIFFSQNQGVL